MATLRPLTISPTGVIYRLADTDQLSGVIVFSNTEPDPMLNRFWFNTATNVLFVSYNDGNSTQWVSGGAINLATPRTIGGVAFDGTANIDLPGVNVTGNQNTTGSAAKLTTSRTINGTAFDGTGDITTVNWGAPRTFTIGNKGYSVNGSINITWSLADIGAATAAQGAKADTALQVETDPTVPAWAKAPTKPSYTPAEVGALPVAGNAVSATKLATARTIGGVAFDGTANIDLPGVNLYGNQRIGIGTGYDPLYSAVHFHLYGAGGWARSLLKYTWTQTPPTATNTLDGFNIGVYGSAETPTYAAITLQPAGGGAADWWVSPTALRIYPDGNHRIGNNLIYHAGNVSNATTSTSGFLSSADKTKLDGIAAGAQVNTVNSVAGKTGAVTLVKADVGLSNVDNTADSDKPISTATQTALNTKVDKVAGKGLSTEDYSTADKNKLAGIAAGAQVNTVNSVAGKTGAVTLVKADVGLSNVDNTADADKPVSTATQTALNTKVDKVAGKGLSTEDYSTAEKSKLAGIAAGAIADAPSDGSMYGRKDGAWATSIAYSEKGVANGVATLDDGGKIPESQIPAVAISDVFTVSSESAMLALVAERGDIAVRSDINKTFALQVLPASTLANWVELRSPTDVVLSVAGKTGVVTLNKGDVGLGNVDNTADADKPISTATQTALDTKVDKVAGKGLSTEDYSTSDKNKLAGIAAGAQVNTVNSVAGKTGAVTLVKADVGLSNVDNTADADKPISTATQTALDGKVDKVAGKGLSTEDYTTAEKSKLSGIAAGAQVNTVNSVAGKTGAVTLVKADVGLANVDNTSDADKPVSTSTQTALDAKVDKVAGKGLSTEDYSTADKNKLAGIAAGAQVNTVASVAGKTGAVTLVKADVGLSNVDNTADTAKPVSTATQTALDTKVDKVAGKGLSTEDYTTTEKSKLSGIAAGAQVNTVTSVASKTGAVTLAKADVGLGDVDNTADADKPVSTSVQTALDGKVDKVTGKGLSTEDYTTTDKNKLAGIAAGAQVNAVDSVAGKTGAVTLVKADVGLSDVDNTADADKPVSTATQTALDGKVDNVAGKGLSTEDYSTAEKNKLAGIAAGAQVNTVTSVAGKTGAVTLAKADVGLSNVDNTADADKPISTATQTALNGKQDSATLSGDVASGIHAATAKATPADTDEFGFLDSAASWVRKKLTWANIKTIMLNRANHTGSQAISTVSGLQAALDAKAAASSLAAVATSGSYADLAGKPSIPAAQVNSDWAAVSGVAQILNKPTLFSGAYADLTGKPTLGSAAAASTGDFATAAQGTKADNAMPKAGGTMTGDIAFAGAQTWPTFNQSTTGNAATATKLATARTIGGVSFDGSANINLPGVNTAGTQNTTGNAATATKLVTARTINGTSFNGTANVTTTKWGTSRTLTLGSTGKAVDGSANVTWTLAEMGAQDASDAVTISGFQTITGVKTFGSNLNLEKNTIIVQNTDAGFRPVLGMGVTGFLDLFHSGENSVRILDSSGQTLLAILSDANGKATFNGGIASGGAAYTYSKTLAHSATPTFDCATGNVFEPDEMTSNVTSITMSNATVGQTVQIRFQQDATGGRTCAVPSGAKIDGSINIGANRVSWLVMTYSFRGARWEGNWLQVPA